MMWKLKENIKGHQGKMYGLRGDVVTIIAHHGNVKIIEQKLIGERFSVLESQLLPFNNTDVTNEPVTETAKVVTETKQLKKSGAKTIATPKEQIALF